MLTAADLAGMRAVQEVSLMDTCTLVTYTPGRDEYGAEVPGWVEQTGVACGLDTSSDVRFSERRRADGTVYVLSALLRLRLADGAALTAKDRVLITHRDGEALAQQLAYGIDGPPQRGRTAVLAALVEVR